MDRKACPTDVSDAEWALVAPYLTLMTEDAPQRDFPLRDDQQSEGRHPPADQYIQQI